MAHDKYNISIPKEIHYIWLGRTFESFDQIPIQDCVSRNPDYRIRLWLDDFSMLEMEGPHGLPRILPAVSLKMYTSGMSKAISSAQINKTFAMLVRAQLEYYKILRSSRIREEISTIQKFQAFLQQKSLPNVDLAFLSDFYAALFEAEHQSNGKSLCYPSLHASSTTTGWENLGPEIQLLQWAFFERYRGNYVAASNLLRVQLLQTHPGIYLDHRTTVPPSSMGQLTGFRFARTGPHTNNAVATQSFLASAPHHPCLQYVRFRLLQNYDALLKRDFRCVTLDYTTMTQPSDPNDFQNPYRAETYSLSGPGAFFSAMKDVAQGALGVNVDIRGAAMEGVGVHVGAVEEGLVLSLYGWKEGHGREVDGDRRLPN